MDPPEKKGHREKDLPSAPLPSGATQATSFTNSHSPTPPPRPVTAGFTWEQKQEQDVAWREHGGLGAGRDLVQRGSEEEWGSREAAKADVTQLVARLTASCAGGGGGGEGRGGGRGGRSF